MNKYIRIRGFTLIELIVVIAIIGILAAILVPSMIGYVNNSRYRTANSNAKEVHQAASVYCTDYDSNPVLSDGTLKTAPASSTAPEQIQKWNNTPVITIQDAVNKYMGNDAIGSYYVVTIKDGRVASVFWCSTQTGEIVGSHPIQMEPESPRYTNLSDCIGKEY